MTKKESTLAGILGEWQRLLEPLNANAADLAHLDGSRLKFATLVTQAVALQRDRNDQRATKQQLSRQLQAVVTDGQRLASLLRAGVKEHYGIRSEKLAAFDLQPFRGRRATTAPEEPEPSTAPVPVEIAAPGQP